MSAWSPPQKKHAPLSAQVIAFFDALPPNWIDLFNQQTLLRGRECWRNGHVSNLVFGGDPDCPSVSARVLGSGQHRYEVNIRLQDENDRGLHIDIACSCLTGNRCKHAACVLDLIDSLIEASMEVADAHLSNDPLPADPRQVLVEAPGASAATATRLLPEWQQLLTAAEPAAPAADTTAWPKDRLLAFMFARGSGEPAWLLATPVLVRPAKRAGYAEARALPPSNELKQPWTANQFEIAAAIQASGGESRNNLNFHRILDPQQEQAIERALGSELCFFERATEGPLKLGPPRDLKFDWSDEADGSQRLRYRIGIGSRASADLLRGHGLWYFDHDSHELGRLSASLAALQSVRKLPPLPPEQASVLTEQLRQHNPLALPAPQFRPPPTRLLIAPRGVLVLRKFSWTRWLAGRHVVGDIAVGNLLFDYGGVRLNPRFTPRERRFEHGVLTEIERDQNAEQALLQRLGDAHWQAAPAYQLYPHPISGNDFIAWTNNNIAPFKEMPRLLEQLRDYGFIIEFDKSYPHHRNLAGDQWFADVSESGSQWFDLSLGVEVEGERMDLLPILRSIVADPAFPRRPAKTEKAAAVWTIELDDERKLMLPLARLRALVDPLWEWLEQADKGLQLRRSQVHVLATIESAARLPWQGGEKLRRTLAQLQGGPTRVQAPKGFKTVLRPYQLDGLAWLNHLADADLGGVLADDMGLGKTVQVLAHLLDRKLRKQLDQPALVVAPTSLVGNWKAEAERFAPQLKVLVIHGADRAARFALIERHDLIITTYPLLQRDRELLLAHAFSLLILDEAQAIKNARSQAAAVVRELNASRRLGMTGTPLENHLGELWAQFDAVEPGLLGDERQFTRLFRTPIEKHQDADKQRRLNARIAPLMLRRRKQDVLTDLPAKTEIIRTIEIEGGQRELYETLRLAQHQRVQQAIAERGLAQSGIIVLDALLKLRQCCCDPRLIKLEHAKKVAETAKLDGLLELLDGLLAEDRRVLLFSQFAEMLGLISSALSAAKIPHQQLTGSTPSSQRSGLVATFQQGKVPVFLISLKAGGVGLNLTAADTVIHYDPWWNPAVEAQATDRAHRIGQDKAVFVYKLICAGTVEEKIQALQARKSELARAVLEGGGASTSAKFNASDLAELFAPL